MPRLFQQDPLAGYTPDWRQRLSEEPATAMRKIMLWWATALAWWRTRFRKQAARVAALEETVRKMSDAVFTRQLVTREVTLVDKTGQVRGTLAVEDNGTAALMFMGEDRHVRIDIVLKDDKPGIYLYDADGKTRAAMNLHNDVATIEVRGAGLAKSMLVARDDTIAVIVTDKDGKPRGILFSDEYELSTYSWLALLDAEGKPVFAAPPVDDGDSGQGDGLDWKKVFGGV